MLWLFKCLSGSYDLMCLFEFSTAIIQAFYKLCMYEWIVTRIPGKLSAAISRDHLRAIFFYLTFDFIICKLACRLYQLC